MLHKECTIVKSTKCTFQGDHKLNLSYTIDQEVSNMLPASSFYVALPPSLPPIYFPLQTVAQLSVKELFIICFLSWA
jgi:hypothetical protein